MGGSSKKVTVGYKYFAGEHMVLCHGPIDKVSEIYVDNRLAWEGESEGGQIEVDATGLFGGQSREGGVSGIVDIEMGAPAQNKNSYLQSILGDAIPAFRGVVSAVLRQCYLGNNPYLKPWSFRAQRIHVTGRNGDEQWYDEKAAILARLKCPLSLSLVLDASGSMIELVDPSPHPPAEFNKWQLQIYEVELALNAMRPAIQQGGGLNIGITFFGPSNVHSGNSLDAPVNYFTSVNSGEDIDLLISFLTGYDYINENGDTDFADGMQGALEFFNEYPDGCRVVVFASDGEPTRFVEDFNTETSTVENDPATMNVVTAEAVALRDQIEGVEVNAIGIGLEFSHYMDQLDNTGGTQLVGYGGGEIRDVILAAISKCAGYDMNPSHIIRETITDKVWGMGYPSADVDDAYFGYAADILFEESMGISLLWDRSSDIEAFQEEILRHINGVLRMDHATGKFQLKLIREDYDVGALPVLDAANIIKIEDYQRPSFSELINTVVVNYWDSSINETASIAIDDPALVLQQGFVNSVTMDYPGFTYKGVASRVGLRDLAALSSPLISCTILCDRSAATLNIGDPFVLDLPDEGINNVVMRVVKGSFGDGKSHAIRLEVAQDVFTSPESGVISDGDQSWESPDVEPEPADYRVLVEAPYYELVQRYGQTATDALLDDNPDVGYLQVSAARPSSAYNAQFVVDSGAGYNVDDSIAMDFCPTATLVAGVGYLDSAWSIENGVDLDQVSVGTHAQINNELFRVDAIDSSAGTLTVGRGVLDTVPALHSLGDRIFFWDAYAESDEIEYADAETIEVKVLPAAGKGVLGLDDAMADSLTFGQRALRPYPPGKFRVNGQYYPSDLAGSVVATWTHRDRLQQTSGEIYDFMDGNIGPEAGVTYTLRLLTSVGGLIDEQSGLSVLTADVPVVATGDYILQLASERGGLESYQHHEFEFYYDGESISISELLAEGVVYFAHRSSGLRYPEESSVAYARTIADGVVWLEQDLYLNADGSLVCTHDASAAYLTTSSANYSTLTDAEVAALTIDSSSWLGVDYSPNNVMLFSDVLATYKGQAIFLPEAKSDNGAEVVAELTGAGIPVTQAIVSAFDVDWLSDAVSAGYPTALASSSTDVLSTVLANDITYIVYNKSVSPTWISDAIAAGVPVFLYTITRRHERDVAIGQGVSGMYSDDPEYTEANTPFATSDNFESQEWMQGMLAGKAVVDTRPTLTERGRFFAPDYWGYADSADGFYKGCLMGWACPVAGDPDNNNWQVNFKLTLGEPSSSDESRWGSIAIAASDAAFEDAGVGNNSPASYHCLMRKNGTMQIYRILGAAGTKLVENINGVAIADDEENEFQLVVTPGKVALNRLDGAGNVVQSVTTGDESVGYRGGYFHLGHNLLPAKYREVLTATVAANPFTPFDLTARPAFFFSEDSALTGGGSYSAWADISGNAHDATQGTSSKRPAATSIGGKGALLFDGANDVLLLADSTGVYRNVGSAWIAAVVSLDAGAAGENPIIFFPVGSGSGTRVGLFARGPSSDFPYIGGRRLDADSFAGATHSESITGAGWVMLLGAMDFSSRTLTLYVDGEQVAQTTGAWSGSGNTSNTDSSEGGHIGTNSLESTRFDGAQAEVMGGVGLPSSTEIDKLFGYMAHKWGLTDNLDAMHPYKSTPPVV